MRLRLGLLSLLLLCLAIPALKAQIVPAVPVVDFGLIREADGPAPYRLYVVNADSVPVAIKRVSTSCGCTAASFMQEYFAPGDSAWIDISFNPSFRPGRFEKVVKVYPTSGETLRIPVTGMVDADEATVRELFPVDGGLLHLSEKQFVSYKPTGEEQRNVYIDVYNSNDFPVWIKVENDDVAFTWFTDTNPLPAKDKSLVLLNINPRREKRKDITEYKANLYTSTSEADLEKAAPVELKVLIDNHGTP